MAEAPEDEPAALEVVEPTESGTEPPALPATPPPVPPATGRGLLIAGGVVGGAGLVARLVTSISAARAARDDGTGSVNVMGVGAVFYTPLIATGLVLTGTAMGRLGHTDAHHELFHGRAPRMKRRAGLGWGLFGAGMLVWTATRLGTGRCGSERCAFRTLELGYYLSLAGTIPGIAIGSYASGYANYRRRKIHLAGLSAAPMISRDLRGVSLGARF